MKLSKTILIFFSILISSCATQLRLVEPFVLRGSPIKTTNWSNNPKTLERSCGQYFLVRGKVIHLRDSEYTAKYLKDHIVPINEILVLKDNRYEGRPTIERLHILKNYDFQVIRIGKKDYKTSPCLPKPLKSER